MELKGCIRFLPGPSRDSKMPDTPLQAKSGPLAIEDVPQFPASPTATGGDNSSPPKAKVEVGAMSVKLDELGPMVVNSDGVGPRRVPGCYTSRFLLPDDRLYQE